MGTDKATRCGSFRSVHTLGTTVMLFRMILQARVTSSGSVSSLRIAGMSLRLPETGPREDCSNRLVGEGNVPKGTNERTNE